MKRLLIVLSLTTASLLLQRCGSGYVGASSSYPSDGYSNNNNGYFDNGYYNNGLYNNGYGSYGSPYYNYAPQNPYYYNTPYSRINPSFNRDRDRDRDHDRDRREHDRD